MDSEGLPPLLETVRVQHAAGLLTPLSIIRAVEGDAALLHDLTSAVRAAMSAEPADEQAWRSILDTCLRAQAHLVATRTVHRPR